MIQVKAVLGLVELMAALKFISNADLVWGVGFVNRTFILVSWTVLSLAIVLVILGFVKLPHLGKTNRSIPHWASAFVFIGLTFYFGQGAVGNTLDGWTESYLPPDLNPKKPHRIVGGNDLESVDKVHELNWRTRLNVAMKEAQQQNKPVFID